MDDKKIISIVSAALLMIFFLLVLVRVFNVAYPVEVTTTTKSTEFSVVGEGKVDVVPDLAYVDVGVMVNNAATVDEAQQSIDTANNNIIAALGKLGIAKTDIKTSNYSILPNYSYENSQNRITGYNGNVTVNVKTKKVSQTNQIIDVATKAGANQITSISFTVENPDKYREEARAKAIANAKEQANKLAKDLGISLGKIVNVVENSTQTPMMYEKSAMMGGAGGGGAQFETGTQTINSVVTLYFEKK